MSNKQFTAIALALTVIIIIVGYIFFSKTKSNQTLTDQSNNPGSLPSGTNKSQTNTSLASSTGDSAASNDVEINQFGLTNFYPLTNKMIAGATTNTNKDASTSVLFIEKSTGYIYQVDPLTRNTTQITNTNISNINRVWWGQNKTDRALIIYYTDKTNQDHWFNATIKLASTSDGELVGADLDQNITDLALSSTGKNIFYLKQEGNQTIGIIANTETTQKTPIFRSIFRDWNTSWNSSSTVLLTSKPANDILGVALLLNSKNYKVSPTLEKQPGLTAVLAPNEKKILASNSSSQDSLSLIVTDLTKKTTNTLAVATLPEKCAWSKNSVDIYCGVPNPLPIANYPDDWYSGETGFSDAIWKIDTNTGSSTLIFSPQTENLGQTIDVYQPFLSADEKYLFLTNKSNLSLWALDLTQNI